MSIDEERQSSRVHKSRMGVVHHLEAALLTCYLLSVLEMRTITAQWKPATATYTKDTDSSIIDEGACGYGDLHKTRYGKYSAGISGMLFNRGSSCGACFEVRCAADHRQRSVVLTATDFCPPNYGLLADNGGWCNFPRAHFQIPEAAFSLIAHQIPAPAPAADHILLPIQYRRTTCKREGGIRFTVKGSAYFMQVLITNVGLDGEVVAVKVKGSRTGWIPMGRNWGQIWQCNINLAGQPLSFEVTTATRRRTLASYAVAPPNWKFGQTFQGKQF